MSHIFCLMGKSSTGKDTIYTKLLENASLGLHRIITGTTRPIREGEQNGREYFFYTEEELSQLKNEGRIIECRGYDTVHGMWYYFTVADDRIDVNAKDYVIITTLEAYENMKKHFGEAVMIPIYLEVDDGIRLERALMRERKEKQPKYAELCRRFLADEEDFSIEKRKEAGIDKIFVNQDLAQTVQEIEAYIRDFGEQNGNQSK